MIPIINSQLFPDKIDTFMNFLRLLFCLLLRSSLFLSSEIWKYDTVSVRTPILGVDPIHPLEGPLPMR